MRCLRPLYDDAREMSATLILTRGEGSCLQCLLDLRSWRPDSSVADAPSECHKQWLLKKRSLERKRPCREVAVKPVGGGVRKLPIVGDIAGREAKWVLPSHSDVVSKGR